MSKAHPDERVRPRWRPGSACSARTTCRRRGALAGAARALPEVELHLIGPLQTNKAKDAVALFDVIETVDRPKLARALAGEMARQGRRPACFVQVNTGEEPQKAGVLPGRSQRLHRGVPRGSGCRSSA